MAAVAAYAACQSGVAAACGFTGPGFAACYAAAQSSCSALLTVQVVEATGWAWGIGTSLGLTGVTGVAVGYTGILSSLGLTAAAPVAAPVAIGATPFVLGGAAVVAMASAVSKYRKYKASRD